MAKEIVEVKVVCSFSCKDFANLVKEAAIDIQRMGLTVDIQHVEVDDGALYALILGRKPE
ncbi:MAG: hypothetical protein IJD18_04270 [Clostridia bacterium]|nr:hypothetical protein [Clostridia bacterium]MBQ3067226.1 hypothetical protein [Clostridia bacterium]